MNTFDESKVLRATDGKFARKPYAEAKVELGKEQEPSPAERLESLDSVYIWYQRKRGESMSQPLSDLDYVGTLIDPETGDDLEVVGFSRGEPGGEHPQNLQESSSLSLWYMDEYGNLYDQPLSDVVEVGTLIDPETGDDMEMLGFTETS